MSAADPTPATPTPATPAAAAPARKSPAARAGWLKQLHQWHWISSALCLIGMILFAVTGITLNHAADIDTKPVLVTRTAQLPDSLLKAVAAEPKEADRKAAVPAPVRDWLGTTLGRSFDDRDAEWTRDEIYLALPRPGGDAWVRIARDSGEIEYEDTDRGWISYLNDLHKGRHTGVAWSWFIDIFAVACLIFSITGLLILKFHAVSRPITWPLVGMGLVIPALLALLLIH
ncbi:MAG: PepSY-associated TM helix domain-containing protein [Burkholderiaceae bacterium]